MVMKNSSHTSTHSRKVGKMSGMDKKRLREFSSVGRAVIKKSDNAKRRRYLKQNFD